MSLDTWVMVGSWGFLDAGPPAEFLDRVQAAGATGLAFGGTPPIQPSAAHFPNSDAPVPHPSDQVMAYADRAAALMAAAAARKLDIYIYGSNPHMAGGSGHHQRFLPKCHLDEAGEPQLAGGYWRACMNDRQFLPYYEQRLRDVYAHWPQISGYLNDGPEFGYEIATDYMDDNLQLFMCFGECCRAAATELDFDFDELLLAARTLQRRLHALDQETVQRARAAAASGAARGESAAVAALATIGGAGVARWFEFRERSAVRHVSQLRAAVRRVDARLRLGAGSRLPAFAAITGYGTAAIAPAADFVLPKMYLWMGGVDGLYGTAYRWVRTLAAWNPGLPDTELVGLVFAAFGFSLPQIEALVDFHRYIADDVRDSTAGTTLGDAFPAEFFSRIVADQVRQMLGAAGAPDRVRPWLHSDHGGRSLSAAEIDQTLAAAAGAGLAGYLFYCPMQEAYLDVASKHAARPAPSIFSA